MRHMLVTLLWRVFWEKTVILHPELRNSVDLLPCNLRIRFFLKKNKYFQTFSVINRNGHASYGQTNFKTSTTMESIEKEFAQLVREQKSTIYTVCYMFSNDEDEVNDLFQEALINLWKGFEAFRHESKVSTWVYRVALNSCISAERKKKRRIDAVPLTMDVNLYEDNDADTKQVRQLHERIQKLGMIDRAIVLMWLENMTYDEIASVIGITPKNVGVKLFRIKQQLMKG